MTKLSPSEKQIEFLRSIGAWTDSPRAVSPAPCESEHLDTSKRGFRFNWLWAAALAAILIFALSQAAFSSKGMSDAAVSRVDSLVDTIAVDSLQTLVDSRSEQVTAVATSHDVEQADTVVLILAISLLFASGVGVALWLNRRTIDAIHRVAVDLSPLTLPTAATELPPSSRGIVAKDHIHRLARLSPPSSSAALASLADYVRKSQLSTDIPIIPLWSWSLGLVTAKGNVRTENQDYGLACRFGEYDIVAVADGMGGLSHGRKASYLGAFAAVKSVIAELANTTPWRPIRVDRILRGALEQAHHTLGMHGDKLRIDGINGGLRTTLILIIAKGATVHFGYIGDGGLDILHPDGRLESILNPQKDGDMLNVLTASLGPQLQGAFVSGDFKRSPGDLIIVSTDGIADRVEASEFARDIMRLAIRNGGDLQTVSEQVVAELADTKDAHGYICDDNLTLALLGTGQAPLLSPGFWDGAKVGTPELPESSLDKNGHSHTTIEREETV